MENSLNSQTNENSSNVESSVGSDILVTNSGRPETKGRINYFKKIFPFLQNEVTHPPLM